MKRFVKMILVLLCVAVITSSSAETEIATNDGLGILSPSAFFNGKYTITGMWDSSDTDTEFNWINCNFVSVEKITYEEAQADAQLYRQALIDSGYFKESKRNDHQLTYIGDREVTSAIDDGTIRNWHVGAYVKLSEGKRKHQMTVNLVEGFNFSDLAVGSDNQKSAEKKQSNAEKKVIATNDGLTVLSPEQYLGIEPCDEIRADDDRYGYVYTDRGYVYHGSGTTNPVDWYRMEEYVNALVESGYYEILEHSSDTEDAYWSLRYIGPAKVKRTFDLYYGMSDQAAITLRNFIGNIKVYYSRDIMTADIDETQQRLGTYYVDTPQNTSSGNLSGDRCTFCGGDGKCDECGGSVWYNDFDFVYVNGAPELQYVRKMCTDANCAFGTCYACGGDGLR